MSSLVTGPNVPGQNVPCTPPCNSEYLICKIFLFFSGTIVPFTLILVSNILIITRVRRAASIRNKMADHSHITHSSVEDKHLTRMLIFVSLAYFILCTPPALYELLFSIPQVKAVYDFRDIYWLFRANIIHWTMITLAKMNHAVNFYLYILAGGRKFREDARKILTCHRSSSM
jgi:hypothetical protein